MSFAERKIEDALLAARRSIAAGIARAAGPEGKARNRPCPCGSKKKYKACCLPRVRRLRMRAGDET